MVSLRRECNSVFIEAIVYNEDAHFSLSVPFTQSS